MMATFPLWAIRLYRACKRLSDKVDDRLFPITDYKQRELDRLYERQDKAEAASRFIRRQIKSCKTLEQSYTIKNMIDNLDLVHGKTIQVLAAKDSLSLALYNKQKSIIEKL